jgi:predicted DNA-binding transcriptional regulator AlpA
VPRRRRLSQPEELGRSVGIGHNRPPEPIEPPTPDPLALLSKRALASLLAINPWTLDRFRKSDPDFPEPIWISGTTPRWRKVEVERWLATRQKGGVSPDWTQSTTTRRRRRRTQAANNA